jgi:hypothetical protein
MQRAGIWRSPPVETGHDKEDAAGEIVHGQWFVANEANSFSTGPVNRLKSSAASVLAMRPPLGL